MRLAQIKDAEELYTLYSHESVSPNMGFDPCSRSEFEAIFSELTTGGHLIVKEMDQRIVAVCKIIRRTQRLRHSAYIGSLAVVSAEQGKGVGRAFFGKTIELLRSEGFTRLELLVAADNEKGISLFRSFGFQIEGTHRSYFSRAGTDALFAEHTMAWVQST